MLFARLLLAIEEAVVNTVPVSAGNVIITSAVEAGPNNVAELVPLSVSSLKIMLPAEVEDPVKVGAVRLLFVKVSEPASVANEPSVNAVLNSAVVPDIVLEPRANVLFVNVTEFVKVTG